MLPVLHSDHMGRHMQSQYMTRQLTRPSIHLGVDAIEDSLRVAEPCASGVDKLIANKGHNWVHSGLAAHSKALSAAG